MKEKRTEHLRTMETFKKKKSIISQVNGNTKKEKKERKQTVCLGALGGAGHPDISGWFISSWFTNW